ncbi:MAG: hypothetical protein IKB49_03760 [Alphaproteobacteria bacterium]|nr:hypothetical protein [Alphaproteobacteria bacterium]
MMKRIFVILFGLLMVMPGQGAGLRITEVDAFQRILEMYFPGDKAAQARVAATYRDNMNSEYVGSVFKAMCEAGGIADDNAKCTQFTNSVLWGATGTYYMPCDNYKMPNDKGSSIKSQTKCLRVFYGDLKTNVQVASAVTLAQEYARVKLGDEIVCSKEYRTSSNDDYIRCKSLKTKKYYEFQFDDVRESVDSRIQQDIRNGIYYIHDVKGLSVSEAKCKEIERSALLFGATTRLSTAANGQTFCYISFDAIKEKKDLKTACGIDNFEFCRSIQINTNLSTIDYMREHVAKKCNADISDIRCDSGFKTYTGPGCATTWMAPKDDVVSCHYNGQQIDFVFDDVNEAFKYVANAGQQAMPCINSDGTFDGKNCVGLDQQNCEAMQKLNTKDCPDCRAVKWDAENKMCVLGAAKFATNVDKAVKIGTVAGVAVVAVAATVFSGGTAAPGAWAVVAATANGLVIAGAATQVTSEAVMTYGVFEPFVKKANLCIQNKDSACAESLVIDELNRMQSYSKEFNQAEARGLDEIFVKLINLIPDDSKFWTDFVGNPEFFDCSVPSDPTTCVVKESAQFWQVARTVGNTAMIAGGFLKMFATIGSTFAQTRDLVRLRVEAMPRHGTLTVNQVNAWGTQGIAMPNRIVPQVAAQFGKTGITTNSQLVKAMGWQLGQELWWNPVTQTIVSVGSGVNLAGLVPIVVGAGNQLYHSPDDADFFVVKPENKEEPGDSETPGGDETPGGNENPGGNETPGGGTTPGGNENPGGGTTPGGNENPGGGTTPGGNENPGGGTTPGGNENPGAGTTPGGNENPSAGTTPTVETKPASVNISHTVEKKSNTGLIATAAVLGTVGAGFLIGGLVGKNGDNKNAATSVADDKMVQELDELMRNASGAFGFITGNALKLVTLPTTNGTMAPIVRIGGRAVAVVEYRGHKFPFWVNSASARWEPLLGIGANGGWFNTCPNPAKADISFIDTIAGQMNTKLSPKTVLYFAGPNASGSNFPDASESAYTIINTEFPNGVVQSFNGGMSPADQMLYNNNYNRIKNLFNTAQIWAVFYCGYSVV